MEPHARVPRSPRQSLFQRQHRAASVLQWRPGERPSPRVGQATGEREADRPADCKPRPEQGNPTAQGLVPATGVYGSLYPPGAPQVPHRGE